MAGKKREPEVQLRGGGEIPAYRLRRMPRKTIALSLGKDGAAEVRAPQWVPAREIDAFVASRREWLAAQSARLAESHARSESFSVAPGGALTLAGREIPVLEGGGPRLEGGRLFVPAAPFASWRGALEAVLREEAARVIGGRVAFFAPRLGVAPASVRIGRSNSAWGVCSAKNALTFTWKLLFAPPEDIDYVVVHELAHIREHNHSPRFWRVVESAVPDWRARRASLRAVQWKIRCEGWD